MFGGGSTNDYINLLLGNDIEITRIEIPGRTKDLGQSRCVHYLKKVCEQNPDRCCIVHATSQGTATALNYCAQSNDKNIKALILEAPLVSANSAILHTTRGPVFNKPTLAGLPFAYYWLPYVAKFLMPFYSPWGPQVIKSLPMLAMDIPIIIIHAKHDHHISFDDACALYYGLRFHGNQNVYLVTHDKNDHIKILEAMPHLQADVRAILQRHGLLEGKTEGDLSIYQPEPLQFKKLYDDLLAKEQYHMLIGIFLMILLAVLCTLLIAVALKRYLKNRRK